MDFLGFDSSIDGDNQSKNLHAFDGVVTRLGSCLILGSKSGRFTGKLDDLEVMPFQGGGLRILIFGQKGDGKSFFEASLFQQLNAFYGYPVLLNDLRNDFVRLKQAEFVKPQIAGFLHKMRFAPQGFPNSRVVVPAPRWSNQFEEVGGFCWRLEYSDVRQIRDVFDRKTFLYSMLGIEADTESNRDRWQAAQSFLDQVVTKDGDYLETFAEVYEKLEEIYGEYASKKQDRALSVALIRQIEETIQRQEAYGGQAFDFYQALRKKQIVTLQGSVGAGMKSPVFQSYFSYPYFLVQQWRRDNEVPRVCNVYEERDAIVRRSDRSLLARLSELNATKGRDLENVDIFTLQDPTNLDSTEMQQFDYVFLTRPNDRRVIDLVRMRNNDERLVDALKVLRKNREPPHEWLWVSASGFGKFTPMPPFCPPKQEKKNVFFQRPKVVDCLA